MRRLLNVTTGVLLLSVALAPVSAWAQDKDKVVNTTGPVTAVTGNSVTIKAKSGELTLTVDSKTDVIGKGMGTKDAAMKADKKSPTVSDFLKVGDEISASYHETSKVATRLRMVKAATPPK
jgi:methyl coenzyme M reductase subunit D